MKQILDNDMLIFECVSGSHAYGTNVPTSDIDKRGIFVQDVKTLLSLGETFDQASDSKNDITYYSLKKFVELAMNCNPNILELLFMPEDTIITMKDPMKKLYAFRHLFVSQRVYHTFGGYAHSQIKRAKGQNKLVHNPMPKEKPERLDFCRIIPLEDHGWSTFKGRPVPIRQTTISLKECSVAKLEHSQDMYRLYHYGPHVKGVFRNGNLVCDSIPIEDENTKLIGFLSYSKDEYENAVKKWKEYWDWVEKRNDQRWLDQESNKVDYDCKNIMHCFRLLMSCTHMLRHGEPLVRMPESDIEYLNDIRYGKYTYEFLMEKVDNMMAKMEDAMKSTKLPYSVNRERINELYLDIVFSI